jgi:N-acetylglucosaminyl-diphospho-decaprenol L-rhamnosyltransferase
MTIVIEGDSSFAPWPINGRDSSALATEERARRPRWFPGLDDSVDDIAIIVVAHNSASFIEACLRSVSAHLGDLSADIVVVDAESDDGTAEIVAGVPGVRLLRCRNRGFAYANNRGLMTCDARYVLFLNPDTEILQGTFSDLVRAMDERPDVGLIGARQVDDKGRLDATIRRFPSLIRTVGDALSAERLSGRPQWLGERELDPAAYDREVECDWTSGSFMLARREAIESAGFFDERFFMYSEETDLCRRIRTAGWSVRHVPWMTILHYGAQARVEPSIERISAHSRMLYARKHFLPVHRALYRGALLLRYGLRSAYPGRGEAPRRRRAASRAGMRTLLGRSSAPRGSLRRYSVRPMERPRSGPELATQSHAAVLDGADTRT